MKWCRTIRKTSSVPIIMLTARGEVTDRIVGLEIGADDYMPKPFEPRELVARVQNVLRRAGPTAPEDDKPSTLEFEGLRIDLERRVVELDGAPLELTTMEYQLLALFAANPGRTYTRDEILNELRGIDAQLFSRSVDILVSRLRQKLGDTTKRPRFIKTVWGTGYTFVGTRVLMNVLGKMAHSLSARLLVIFLVASIVYGYAAGFAVEVFQDTDYLRRIVGGSYLTAYRLRA